MTKQNTINTMYTIAIADAYHDNWIAVVYASTLHDALLQFAANLDRHAHAAMYSIDVIDDADFVRKNLYADTMPATIDDLNAAMRAIMPDARLSVAN